jgi:hypothetical protein
MNIPFAKNNMISKLLGAPLDILKYVEVSRMMVAVSSRMNVHIITKETKMIKV